MSDNIHKKKTIKWMIIGGICGCVILVSSNISVSTNDGSMQLISALIGAIALLMSILSGVMYMVHYTLAWTRGPTTSQKQDTEQDTLVKISQLYKEGLLTKEEFETQKTKILRGKDSK